MSDTTDETQWYIARAGEQHGPLTDPEIQLFVTGGHLKPTDLIWRPGFTEWRQAQVVFPPTNAPTEPKPAAATETTTASPSSTPESPAGTDTDTGTIETTGKPQQAPSTTGPATQNLSARAPFEPTASPSTQTPSSAPTPANSQPRPKTGSAATPTTGGQPAQNNPATTQARPSHGTPHGAPKPPAGTATPGGRSPQQPTLSSSPLSPASPLASPTQQHQSAGIADRNKPHGQSPYQQHSHPDASPFSGGAGAPAPKGAQGTPSAPSMLGTPQPHFDQHRPSPAHELDSGQRSVQPAETDTDEFDYPQEPKRSTPMRALASIAVIALIGGLGYLGYQNQDQLKSFVSSMVPTGTNASSKQPPPVVTANRDLSTSPDPNPQPATPPQAAPDPALLAQLDEQFQKSPLWSLLKSEYPQWYQERLKQVIRLNTAGDDPEVTKKLLAEIVALRRKHADEALAASTDKLRGVASAFLANLQRLGQHSPDACSTFISNGELSPKVLNLLAQKEFGPTLEVQATAIFQAISEGRKSPVKRTRAGKTDYNVLTRQLSKMGWTPQDFQLFANRSALASAPAAKKCQMLQDWFAAHIAIPDASVQERLLFETLRPVVAG